MLDSYSSLLAAVRDDLDRDDENIDALIKRFVFLAENQISKRLRVAEMEDSARLMLVDGIADLPVDYVGVRHVYCDGTELFALTSKQAIETYPSPRVGLAQHFVIEGGKIKVYPQTSGDLTLGYYAKIPHLSDAVPSGWLLRSSPELLLRAALVQGFTHFQDMEEVASNAEWVNADIAALMDEDSAKRFAFLAMPSGGVTP